MYDPLAELCIEHLWPRFCIQVGGGHSEEPPGTASRERMMVHVIYPPQIGWMIVALFSLKYWNTSWQTLVLYKLFSSARSYSTCFERRFDQYLLVILSSLLMVVSSQWIFSSTALSMVRFFPTMVDVKHRNMGWTDRNQAETTTAGTDPAQAECPREGVAAVLCEATGIDFEWTDILLFFRSRGSVWGFVCFSELQKRVMIIDCRPKAFLKHLSRSLRVNSE